MCICTEKVKKRFWNSLLLVAITELLEMGKDSVLKAKFPVYFFRVLFLCFKYQMFTFRMAKSKSL